MTTRDHLQQLDTKALILLFLVIGTIIWFFFWCMAISHRVDSITTQGATTASGDEQRIKALESFVSQLQPGECIERSTESNLPDVYEFCKSMCPSPDECAARFPDANCATQDGCMSACESRIKPLAQSLEVNTTYCTKTVLVKTTKIKESTRREGVLDGQT